MIENWNHNGNFLFTEEEFNKANSRDKVLPLKCLNCEKVFYTCKNEIMKVLNKKRKEEYKYCSVGCLGGHKTELGTVIVKCEQCGKEFRKQKSEIKKTEHNFCSQSCACRYHNIYKITGCNRSKIELYLENLLTKLYDFEIIFNDRQVLPSHLELDVYIPNFELAFEINGITHYKPIFGEEKYKKIKVKDLQKYNECKDLDIKLFVFDVSKKYYSFDFYYNLYNKIIRIINKKTNLNKSFTEYELKQIMNDVNNS